MARGRVRGRRPLTPEDLGRTPIITDGGLATELERRGNDLADPLWSARLLLDSPSEIVAAHKAFFDAGATIATTASYQASYEGFAARGVDRSTTTTLLRRSVTLATRARDECTTDATPRWVAASVGPYGAFLADGSEYRGRYGKSTAALTAWHRPRLDTLAEATPDLLALETIPDTDEAEALLAITGDLAIPTWLTYTITGTTTRAGQPLTEAFALADSSPEVIAVGVNCSHPRDIPTAIHIARRSTTKPVIVYPNSGEDWTGTWTGDTTLTAGMAQHWAAEGATIIGGCCRVGPDRIAEIATLLHPNP